MENIESNGCIGHPITNLLMQAASAADMGAADHVDHGAVIELESGAVLTMNRQAANIEMNPAKPGEGVTGHATVDVALLLEQIEANTAALYAMVARVLATSA